MTIEFPTSTFPAPEIRWRREGAAINGGTSISGQPSSIDTSGGGYWSCDLTVQLYNASMIRAARAFLGSLDGGANAFNLRTCEARYAPYPGGVSGATITVTAATAALRATSLTLTLTAVATLTGGEHFSITHTTLGLRQYEIIGISGTTATIRPPLREAISGPAALDFMTPGCLVKCTNVAEALSAISMGDLATLTLQCVETFDV